MPTCLPPWMACKAGDSADTSGAFHGRTEIRWPGVRVAILLVIRLRQASATTGTARRARTS